MQGAGRAGKSSGIDPDFDLTRDQPGWNIYRHAPIKEVANVRRYSRCDMSQARRQLSEPRRAGLHPRRYEVSIEGLSSSVMAIA